MANFGKKNTVLKPEEILNHSNESKIIPIGNASVDLSDILQGENTKKTDTKETKNNTEDEEQINEEYGKIMKNIGSIGKEHIIYFARQIANILETSPKKLDKKIVLDLFNRHSVLLDLGLNKKIEAGKEATELSMEVVSGLPKGLKIRNPEVFLFFCRIHGLVPIINNISIENIDINKVRELYVIFNFFIEYIKRGKEINFAIFGEINKILQELEEYGIEGYDAMHLSYLIHTIGQMRALGTLDILTNFGNKLQKKNNLGVIYENIFLETAFRIENEIRDTLGFHNTYLYQASFWEDSKEKTDFKWYYQVDEDEKKSSARMIPIQLTAMHPNGFHKKLNDVETFLMEHVYREDNKLPFLVVNTYGDFPKTIIDNELIDLYEKWQGNKEVREKQKLGRSFPFFIDTVNRANIGPAKMVIVAMHIIEEIIHKNYRFSDEHNNFKGTISSMTRVIKKKLDVDKRVFIDSVKLKKLKIKVDSIEKKELGQGKHFFYAINFTVGYNGNQAGQITIYRQ